MAQAPRPYIPQTAVELTAQWFTEILAAPRSASVTWVDTEPVGEGVGFVGELFRCKLRWDSDHPDLVQSVVVKVPSTVAANRGVGEGLLAYEREIAVYRDLTDGLGLPMPTHIYSELEPNPAPWLARVFEILLDRLPLSGVNWMIKKSLDLPDSLLRRYVLVMEDIDDARPAAQFDGGTLDDAIEALELLAKFHAANWMNESLLNREPLVWSVARTPKVFQASYLRNRDDFVERFGELLGPAMVARLDAINTVVPELGARLAEPPWTVLHGDYRLDNLLFRPGGEIVVLDYQLLSHGRAGWDVAYFITTALDPTHRADEQRLLRAYHDALVGDGIGDYSYEDLLADTNLTKELLAHRVVGGADVLETQVEGRDESFIDVLLKRVTGWIED